MHIHSYSYMDAFSAHNVETLIINLRQGALFCAGNVNLCKINHGRQVKVFLLNMDTIY